MADNMNITKRQELETLRGVLETAQATFTPHWRDLADYVLPRRAQFTLADTHKGGNQNTKIVDSTATLASRTLRSGMMGGVTSPARPWFKLSTHDTALAELGPVKGWLHQVAEGVRTVFLKSNLYQVLPTLYGDMGTFATGAVLVEEDLDTVLRFYALPIGSYKLALDDRGFVSVMFRELNLSVRQVLRKFGAQSKTGEWDWSNFSANVKALYEQKQLDTIVSVCHVIRPNEKYDPDKLGSKRYESLYYEKGQQGRAGTNYIQSRDEEVYLRERGYDFFPVLTPRWEITGEDVYGTDCPGMSALGDIKALQTLQKRKAQAIDKKVNPPMVAPTALRRKRTSILPGDITYVDVPSGSKGFEAAIKVEIDLSHLAAEIQQHQERIRRAYYEDLFLMLAMTDRREITAREIDERHEEKLLALGPVLEQLNQDLLDRLIDIAFIVMDRQGLIPEPPEELQDQDLKVEYISIMHQAQKLAGLAGIERLARFALEMAAADPSALDKLDVDQLIDTYADVTGVPPDLVRPDDAVDALRQARAQAQAQAEAAQGMAQGAQAAKALGATPMDENSALGALLNQAQAGQV